MRSRTFAGLVAALAATLGWPAAVTAHDEPASHILPVQDVFFPYAPATSDGIARALLTLTRRTRAAGWPVKVAIIATPGDLGAAGEFFGLPQDYADFLAAEFGGPRLLVVMPQGFGGQRLGEDFEGVLTGLSPVAPGDRADGLVLLALTAVARLAASNGHPVAFPKIDRTARGLRPYRVRRAVHPGRPNTRAAEGLDTSASSGAGTESPLPFVAPVALVLLMIGTRTLVDRRRRPER